MSQISRYRVRGLMISTVLKAEVAAALRQGRSITPAWTKAHAADQENVLAFYQAHLSELAAKA